MLSSYPIKINNEAIPFPDSWNENPKKIASQFETESGHRKVLVQRTGRLAISARFTVSSRWLKKFMQWRDAASFTLSKYDAVTGAYTTHTMDIDPESFSYDLVRHSELVKNTEGLYYLSFDMEEF